MLVIELNRSTVGLCVLLNPFPVRLRRLCRVEVVFPDVGNPFINAFGFLRYEGERKLQATPGECAFLRSLTINLL